LNQTENKPEIWKLTIIGALAGAANGFFGAGGGLFLVPLFTKWLKIEQKRAFAMSVAVVFPLSIVSMVVYFFKGNIQFMPILPILCGGFVGGIIAGQIFGKIPAIWLRRAFGVLIVWGGVRALLLL